MHLSPEEKRIGKHNFGRALDFTRRDFLKAAAAAPAVGAFYFGYSEMHDGPLKAGLIGTGRQGSRILSHSNPDYVRFTAVCDIRPSQLHRIRYGEESAADHIGMLKKYEVTDEQLDQQVRQYDDYLQLLADSDVELVVIAVPLHLHHQITSDALAAGKHVFCETQLAKSAGECKELGRAAATRGLKLAVGYQRHYNILYDNAINILDSGLLGDVRHIRARWHYNHSWPVLHRGEPLVVDGQSVLQDSMREVIPEMDQPLDFAKYGYQSLEELCWWPLYHRTGGGLMAEMGTHQLDACVRLLGGAHPLAVSGTGGKTFFEDDREIDDHLFLTFEFPGLDHPLGVRAGANLDDIVFVTYSCVATNALESYGEQVFGTRGTLLVDEQREVLLFKEVAPETGTDPKATEIAVATSVSGAGELTTSASDTGGDASAAPIPGDIGTFVNRGYGEQLEHFAWCIRNPDADNQPRCGADVGLANVVMASVADAAVRQKTRIEFEPEWFDIDQEATPGDGLV